MADQTYEERLQRYQEMAADTGGALGSFLNGVAEGAGAAPTAAAPWNDADYQATLEEYREQGEEWGERVGGALGGALGGLATAPVAPVGAGAGAVIGAEIGQQAGAELGVDIGRVVESDDPGEVGAGVGGMFGNVTGMGHDETAAIGRDLGNDPYVVEEFEATVEAVATFAIDPDPILEQAAVSTFEYATDFVDDYVCTAEAALDEFTTWLD